MREHRSYGLEPSNKYLRGKPTVVGTVDQECPVCKCSHMYQITVPVEHPLLTGQEGVGMYVGCACCPYASKMLMASTHPGGKPQ